MFTSAMWRFLAPFGVVAFAITGATAFVYGDGAPAWVVYLGGVVALLVVLAPLAVWEDRHHSLKRTKPTGGRSALAGLE